jgi:PST family polysaccharide transporter
MTVRFRAASLTDRTASAAKWRVATSAIGAVSTFIVGVLLARLLAPADFGLTALAFVTFGFVRPLADLGLGNAIIQRADLTERHVRVGFTVAVSVGLASALLLAAAAPLAAHLLHDARVTPVLRALSATFVLSAVGAVAGALLRRRLDFRRLFFVETASYVLGYGMVACVLAIRGYGVWSLIWGILVQTLMSSAIQLAAAGHSVRPLIARREMRQLLNFGVGSATSNCVNYIALNADNFIVGRVLGAASLGYYNRAYMLMNAPHTYASSVMSSLLFPAFAEAQGRTDRVRRAFLLATQLIAMVAAPAMVMMSIVAPHLVRGLYGPKWVAVVVPLQILCVAGYFRALYHLGGVVAQSLGLVYGELRNQALYAVLVIVGALGAARYGLPGVATGVGIAILCMFVLTSRLALTATGVEWRAYMRVQRGAIANAAVAGLVALVVRQWLAAYQIPNAVIAMAVLAAAAVPWGLGLLWMLGEPHFEPLRPHLARPILSLVTATRTARQRGARMLWGGSVATPRQPAL